MSVIGDRLKLAMSVRGVDQPELANAVGCTQGAVSQIISGGTMRSRFLPDMAEFLQIPLSWLKGDGPPLVPEATTTSVITPQQIAEDLDMVSISEIDLAFGMGATFTDVPIETRALHFPREWVESITSAPASMLLIARGRGDSMMPTLLDGDMVLIDRSQRTIREQDGIWAITMGDVGMIKRVRARPRGSYAILSDNPSVPPDQADDGEMAVVGRVVFIGRRT